MPLVDGLYQEEESVVSYSHWSDSLRKRSEWTWMFSRVTRLIWQMRMTLMQCQQMLAWPSNLSWSVKWSQRKITIVITQLEFWRSSLRWKVALRLSLVLYVHVICDCDCEQCFCRFDYCHSCKMETSIDSLEPIELDEASQHVLSVCIEQFTVCHAVSIMSRCRWK